MSEPNTLEYIKQLTADREPDFNNLLAVLRRERPSRPTLFEFFLNVPLYQALIGDDEARRFNALLPDSPFIALNVPAFRAAGYDYATLHGSSFAFRHPERERGASISTNHGGLVTDEASFEAYDWPDPEAFDYSRLEILAKEMVDGMKLICFGPYGVLENAIEIVGYEELCFLIADESPLAREIFDAIGSRLLRYYEICLQYDAVGAIISNDDWGFKTQTMLAPDDLRKYVFPWHKKIVQAAHAAGRPAILHSCGQPSMIWDDIIDDMDFQAKHSYEDAIIPVEDCYDRVGERIAILGGLDLDYVCRSTPEDVNKRAKAMLERTQCKGYALGTGNSIPDYVPIENYCAMIRAALKN